MKYPIYFIFICLLFGINLGLFSLFKIHGVAPNLLLLVVILFALEKNNLDFLFVSLISGLFLDFHTGLFLGSFSFGLLILSFAINILARNLAIFEIKKRHIFLTLVVSILFLDAFLFGYNFFAFKLGQVKMLYVSLPSFKARFLAEVIYNSILIFPVFWAKEQVENLFLKLNKKTL
jgi:rod shape-determining protein MreD